MSGHSHFAGIKHRKGINDAKRAKVFTKLAKPIVIAAREGGGNPATNFKLRLSIDKAREFNMPKDNIDRAIKRGTGELKDASVFQEIVYEAYGPGQVAMLIKTLTENKNRTLTEVKNILNKNGGKMVPEGSVSFMFSQMGYLELDIAPEKKEEMELMAIEAGAEEIINEGEIFIILTKPENLQNLRDKMDIDENLIKGTGLDYIAGQKVKLSDIDREKYEKLAEALEENEDVQDIYDNQEA